MLSRPAWSLLLTLTACKPSTEECEANVDAMGSTPTVGPSSHLGQLAELEKLVRTDQVVPAAGGQAALTVDMITQLLS